MEEREEEKEGRWTVRLQPAYAQELRKFVREASGSCINSEGLNHYINELKEDYKESIQPAAGSIVSLALTMSSSCAYNKECKINQCAACATLGCRRHVAGVHATSPQAKLLFLN